MEDTIRFYLQLYREDIFWSLGLDGLDCDLILV